MVNLSLRRWIKVLNPQKLIEEVQKALKEADVILDFSASVAVARSFRDVESAVHSFLPFLIPQAVT